MPRLTAAPGLAGALRARRLRWRARLEGSPHSSRKGPEATLVLWNPLHSISWTGFAADSALEEAVMSEPVS
jgi:hypothetical protein